MKDGVELVKLEMKSSGFQEQLSQKSEISKSTVVLSGLANLNCKKSRHDMVTFHSHIDNSQHASIIYKSCNI